MIKGDDSVRLSKKLLTAGAFACVLAIGGANAAWASSPASISYSTKDGGGKVTGTITFYSAYKWSYDLNVTDLKADGYAPSVQIWEEQDDRNDSWLLIRNTNGSGTTIREAETRTQNSKVLQVEVMICTGVVGTAKCDTTIYQGNYNFNPYH